MCVCAYLKCWQEQERSRGLKPFCACACARMHVCRLAWAQCELDPVCRKLVLLCGALKIHNRLQGERLPKKWRENSAANGERENFKEDEKSLDMRE